MIFFIGYIAIGGGVELGALTLNALSLFCSPDLLLFALLVVSCHVCCDCNVFFGGSLFVFHPLFLTREL